MRWLVGGLFVAVSTWAWAAPSLPSPGATDRAIQRYYAQVTDAHAATVAQRIRAASRYFLGRRYQLGALGEGPHGRFDQDPLYRTDAFDCTTFVSTVLALAHATDLKHFKQRILQTRYQHQQPRYIERLHFTSVDWNQHQQQQHWLKDVTTEIKDTHGRAVAQMATALINKPSWYRHHHMSSLVLRGQFSTAEKQQRLQQLQQLSNKVKPTVAHTSYLPINALFDRYRHIKPEIAKQCPDVAVLEIVRPNWNLTSVIGTHLNISHMGFLIRTPHGLVFREASSLQHQVIDVPLATYLHAYQNKPQTFGIHIEAVT